MSNVYRTEVARCPKCNVQIWNDHTYPWCAQCGEAFPKEIKELIPQLSRLQASENIPRYDKSSYGNIMVSQLMIEHLQATRPWVRFLGVLSYIVVGLMVLGGMIAMVALSSTPRAELTPEIAFVYMLLALLYIAPALYLNRYASAISELVQGGGAYAIEKALESQKAFWRYVGICTVVVLCIYALVFVIAMLFAVTRIR